MHGLQGTFPCCKKCLLSDPKLCRWVIKAIMLVHNFRTNYVRYSQIQTVFSPEYVRIRNLQGHDQITQYYFCPGDYDSEVDGDRSGSDGKCNED
jgi:hypothetical protein